MANSILFVSARWVVNHLNIIALLLSTFYRSSAFRFNGHVTCSEDRPQRWKEMNYIIAVARSLRYNGRMAMASYEGLSPTLQANVQILLVL